MLVQFVHFLGEMDDLDVPGPTQAYENATMPAHRPKEAP